MNIFLKFLYILLLIFISSCVSNLQKLANEENKLRLESIYSSYLALEYLEYSRSLLSSGDWHNAQYFAKKGLDVASGEKVALESPYYWASAQENLEDHIYVQKRYEAVANPEIKKILPIQIAHLTFLYDCWVSKELKPVFRKGELGKCKDRFYKLLEEVEYYVDNLGKDKEPKTIIKQPEFSRYLIAFDLGKFNFNDKANKKFIEVLNEIDDLDGNYKIILVGSADRLGKNLYNENLALKRAKTVESYLVKNGVSRDLIKLVVMGEEFPDIITQDKKQQQYNRTVAVFIVKGLIDVDNMPLPVIKNEAYKKEVEDAKKQRGLM